VLAKQGKLAKVPIIAGSVREDIGRCENQQLIYRSARIVAAI
jgi:hypothetical protein